jgi:hypothetical protein
MPTAEVFAFALLTITVTGAAFSAGFALVAKAQT